MEAFTIKRGDTSPALVFTLSPAVNLTGATVVFNMRGARGGPVASRVPAGIVGDPTAGVVSYNWRPEDTSRAGLFRAEFEVTYGDGAVETFPNHAFIPVSIEHDLG